MLEESKIVELSGVCMDVGAPLPMLLESDLSLYLIFRGYDPGKKECNEETEGTYILEFDAVSQYKFGTPNDEVLHGHPYYKIGLKHYGFFEVLHSDWIKNLKKINSVHDRFDENKWKNIRHFILTFKEDTFECVSTSYSIQFEYTTLESRATEIFNGIIKERLS